MLKSIEIFQLDRNSELTAASASSAECLRAQLREQRSRYEARIADLEMRLTKAAAAASKAMPAAPTKAKVKIPKSSRTIFSELSRFLTKFLQYSKRQCKFCRRPERPGTGRRPFRCSRPRP